MLRRFLDEGLPQGSYSPTCTASRLPERRRAGRMPRVYRGTRRWNPARPVRNRLRGGFGRHGRGLSRARHAARPRRRPEGDGAAHRLRSAHAFALRDRSARGRVAEPSRYSLDLRAGGRRRRSVRGDGAARRPQPSRADFEGAAAVARGGRDRRRDCRRPGGRARQGNRPPRLEARERLPDQRRPRQDSRLRSRAAAPRRRGVRSTDRRRRTGWCSARSDTCLPSR